MASRQRAGPIPLAALFGKVDAAQMQVSPQGKYLGWLARSPSGVLDLWVAPLPLPKQAKKSSAIPGAMRLTAAEGRDICFSFRFTLDDERVVYLRETEHGSEMYHLYSLEVPRQSELGREGWGENNMSWKTPPEPVKNGRDLLAAYPHLTCAVGFAGGLQLWLPRSDPRLAVLATGRGSLLWDLSSLSLDTGTLTTIRSNPAYTHLGRLKLLIAFLLHAVAFCVTQFLAVLSIGLRLGPTTSALRASALRFLTEHLAPAPSAPVQYFMHGDGTLVGTAEAALGVSGLAMRFCYRCRRRGWAAAGGDIPFSRLNMQLIGSGAATGTMRMDRLGLAGPFCLRCRSIVGSPQ